MSQQPPEGYGPPAAYYVPRPKPGLSTGVKILVAIGVLSLFGMALALRAP